MRWERRGAGPWRTRHGSPTERGPVSYLMCPTCRFTVSAAAASSPFHNCPRCLLRDGMQVVMVTTTRAPRRFTRPAAELERITEAKARLRPPPRGIGSV